MKDRIVRPSGFDSGPILGPSLRTSPGDVLSTARAKTASGLRAEPNLVESSASERRTLLEAASPLTSRRFLPVLLVLFVGSGCAALIYEIVWFQLLELVIGSSAVSLGVLLGTFMGGMCLGSLLLPRIIPARHHPLRVYAALELGIGAIGLLLLFGMPLIGGVYMAWAGSGAAGIVWRAIAAAVCLLA